MIARVKARMEAGEDVPDCVVKTLILIQEQENLDWDDMCMLSAAFTIGGVHSVRPNFIQFVNMWWLNQAFVVYRHRALSCGFWRSSYRIQKFKLVLMQSLTR